jgi:PadR family transcriptional regulator, regulatory protein AphA
VNPSHPLASQGERDRFEPMSLDYLVLGIVKDRPISGYDLTREFEHVVQYFWQAEQSQVYRALYRLRDAGWVSIREVAGQNAPNRKIYRITARGRRALEAWLSVPPPPPPTRLPWLGQVYFSDQRGAAALGALLEQRITTLKLGLRELDERRQGNDWDTIFAFQIEHTGRLPTSGITLEYGVAMLKFEIEWAQRTLGRLPALEAQVRDQARATKKPATRGPAKKRNATTKPKRAKETRR